MVPYQNKDYACFTMGKNETDDYDINTEINIFFLLLLFESIDSKRSPKYCTWNL